MKTRASDNTPLTAAQARLVETHAEWARRGAYKHAAKFARYVTVDELVSAAHLGLIMAARRFDPSRGFVFKTLAMPYCESLMRREVDTRRRLNGCVFDHTVEGGMRTVLQRVEWPTYEDGRPRDLVAVPAQHHDDVVRADAIRHLRRLAETDDDRRLLDLVTAGLSVDEMALRLQLSGDGVRKRLDSLIVRMRRRHTLRRRQVAA